MTSHARTSDKGPVVALSGGVGGAKLALGLQCILGADLTVIANTGDDFEHLGLTISPDLDTLLYTLGGLSNMELGWGRSDESWHFLEALEQIGGETWFRLGDRDLALHVERTHRLRSGETLTAFIGPVAKKFGIDGTILPMSDDPVRTVVATPEGLLPFQRYFVERRCEPRVESIRFIRADNVRPTDAVRTALQTSELRAIIICPSNPYLSIDPILAVPGIRQLLIERSAPAVAVSPLIGGTAVKGPTAKIMSELGIPTTSAAIAAHYAGLIDGIVIDNADADESPAISQQVHVTQTLMRTNEDRERLARETMLFADRITANPIRTTELAK